MGLKLVSAPATLPVTLTEAKEHLRVDFSDDDDLITLLLTAAVDYVDGPNGFLKQALVDQTWDLYLDEFPDAEIKIPLGPLIEVSGVFYTDEDETEQEVDSTLYVVDTASDFPWVLPAFDVEWPTPLEAANSVRVRFRSGYVDNSSSPASGDIPFAIKAGILLHLGSLYAHRETVVVGQTPAVLPWGAEQLLRPHRKHTAIA